MAWAPPSGGGSPAHPCLPPWDWGSSDACLLCYSAEQLVRGDVALLGVAVKLFIGEVGAGNEAKSQP